MLLSYLQTTKHHHSNTKSKIAHTYNQSLQQKYDYKCEKKWNQKLQQILQQTSALLNSSSYHKFTEQLSTHQCYEVSMSFAETIGRVQNSTRCVGAVQTWMNVGCCLLTSISWSSALERISATWSDVIASTCGIHCNIKTHINKIPPSPY